MRRTPRTLALALALIGGIMVLGYTSSGSPHATPQTLAAYESKLVPLVQAGGRTVEQGMKPGIDDLRYRHVVPPPMIAQEAAGWLEDLTQVRNQMAALRPSAPLGQINASFVRSLNVYLAACRVFKSAAAARPPTARAALIEQGITLATEADHLYDKASAQLQGVRHQLHLPPNNSFPSKSTGGQT